MKDNNLGRSLVKTSYPHLVREEIKEARDMLLGSKKAVVLTGAGISTPSGIPDFRTPESGIWANQNPFDIAHIDVFNKDPEKFWRFYASRFLSLHDKKPNSAHYAVAKLEQMGLIEGVITQNIDRLHKKAGSNHIIEMHGSIEYSHCPHSGCEYKECLEEIVKLQKSGFKIPICESCQEPLKPEVVLFGEALDENALNEAFEMAYFADLIIVIGSSLEVHPVSNLPGITLDEGGKLLLITKSDTPYDNEATLKLSGELDKELDDLLALL